MGLKMVEAPAGVAEAVRNGEAIEDGKLEALRRFTQSVVERRGEPGPEEVEGFLAAGYDSAQMLDVLAGVTQKTLSNYTNHLADTPLDEALEPFAWEPGRAAAV